MRRMLLGLAAAALLGGLAVVATASVEPAPRTAGSGGPATGVAPAPEVPETGPFAAAARGMPPPRGEGWYAAEALQRRQQALAERSERSERRERDAVRRSPRRGGHAGLFRMRRQVARDLADRLDVDEPRMDAALADVLRRALAGSRDRRTWAARKRRAIDELAAEVDRPTADVAAAARNELRARLRRAVTFGTVTSEGRTLALGCFDDPRRCDVAALRREIHGGARRPR